MPIIKRLESRIDQNVAIKKINRETKSQTTKTNEICGYYKLEFMEKPKSGKGKMKDLRTLQLKD